MVQALARELVGALIRAGSVFRNGEEDKGDFRGYTLVCASNQSSHGDEVRFESAICRIRRYPFFYAVSKQIYP